MKMIRAFYLLPVVAMATAGVAQETLKVSDAWTLDAISFNARLTAVWMTANPKKHHPLDWTYGAFYAGITELGLSDPTLPYLDQIRTLGKTNAWDLRPRTYHADDHCIGQSWLELAAFDNNPAYAERVRQTYDQILANPQTNSLVFDKERTSTKRWSWCDALFMSPTVLVKLAGFTGETKYLTFMDQEFKATYDLLYSKEHRFFFRDSRFFDKKTRNGKNVFWCRGNGWVFGALPIILRDLPADWPTRAFYVNLFKEMAVAVKNTQQSDGSWHPSLLDAEDPNLQEMSGTSFFTFGLLWGINNGVLDRAEYLPCVQNAWKAITKNINADGRLGWTQPIGGAPASYTEDSHEVYAVGAYLFAAMELRKLVVADAHPARKIINRVNPLGLFRSAETVTLAWPQPGLTSENLRVFDVRNGAVLPHRLNDKDGDGNPDELAFTTCLLARQTRPFWLFNSAAQETRKVSDAWTLDAISYNAKLTADWMTAHPKKHNPRSWPYGAFYTGIAALGLSDPNLPYLNQIRELGKTNKWTTLPKTYHADDHCIGQSWLELAAFDNNPTYAENLRQTYDTILANPHTGTLDFSDKDCLKRWCWCDALFMSPTVLVKMYGLTGETKYLTFMDQEYKATTDFLYDKTQHLYYRDSRFFDKKTKNGKSVFWCRGNGWVFGSLPIILRDLPADWPTRPFYVNLYKEMAVAVKQAQHADGAWRPSLLDPEDPNLQEMSGTSFFTYGLLWGINNGVLDRAEYLPCVQKAWKAITRNINAEGRLGWAQPTGDRPNGYTAEDHEVYAVGAYLCAAMELRKLVIADAHPARKTVDIVNPLGRFRSAETVTLDWAKLGMKADQVRVFDVRNSAVLPHQLIDANGDGTPDELLFKTYTFAKQSRSFWIFESDTVPAAPAAATCFSRYVPERMDDYAWENDRMAYRTYGPKVSESRPAGEGLISSGIDVWCKRVRYPVINAWYKGGKYHDDQGEGCDFYKVGTGRGCGGLGVFRDGACFVSGNWATQKHIASGPVRTVFELTYAPWECGTGVKVSETRRVSLDAGSHLTRFESRVTLVGTNSIAGGPGLDIAAKHAHSGVLSMHPEQGWLTNYEPAQKKKGSIATALVLPQTGSSATDSQECTYLLGTLTSDKPFVWYAGAGWSGAGDFVNPEYWNSYVSAFADALRSPLKITIR